MSFLLCITPKEHSSITETLNIQQTMYNFVHISPVNSSSSLYLHPVQGKVNLPNERGHSLHNSVGHAEDYARLLPHYPRGGKKKKKAVIQILPQNRKRYPEAQHLHAAVEPGSYNGSDSEGRAYPLAHCTVTTTAGLCH